GNNLFLDDPAPFLWRNTLIGFFGKVEADGSIQQGTFQTALKFFEEICQLAEMPKQDFTLFYEQLRQCAMFIFDKTQSPEQIGELLQLRRIYDLITEKTADFVVKMKKIICDVARMLETNTHEPRKLQEALEQ